MKEDLLGVLEQIEPESIDTAEVMVEAMSSVTNNVEELSSKAQVCQLLGLIPHSTLICGQYFTGDHCVRAEHFISAVIVSAVW